MKKTTDQSDDLPKTRQDRKLAGDKRKAEEKGRDGRGGSTDRKSDGFGGRAPTGPSGRKAPSGTPPKKRASPGQEGDRKPRSGSDSNRERKG